MDPAPPEKDRYSYDEMMASLRQQRSGGGDRRVKVESADGTVEVKRRKRRSSQPKKNLEDRVAKWKKIALLTAIPAVMLIVGLYLLMKVRYQSDGFRSGVSDRAGAVMGAPAELAALTIKGLTARSRSLKISPLAGQFLRDAEFINVQGNLTAGSMFSSDWHLTNLIALHAKLRFQPPTGPLADAGADSPGHSLVTAGLGLSSEPDQFLIDKFHIGSADFTWGDVPREIVFLEDATLNSKRVGNTTDLYITNAKLKFKGWPEFDLDSARLDVSRSQIRVVESLLNHQFIASRGGSASLTGMIDLASASPSADFVCQFNGMPIESLISKPFVGKLNGDVDATLNFKADLTNPGSLVVSGPFWIREGSFGDFIPTKRLAVFLAEPRISRVQFHSIRGKITVAQGTRTVEEIDAVAPDFLKIGGRYTISPEGLIEGELLLSINNKVLDKLPGGRPIFFTQSTMAPNMSSTPIKVGGTSTSPTEDLTERIEAALKAYELKSAKPPASAYPTIPSNRGAENKSPTTNPREKAAEDAFNKLIEP